MLNDIIACRMVAGNPHYPQIGGSTTGDPHGSTPCNPQTGNPHTDSSVC